MMHCTNCGFENPAGFSFCGQCGGALDASTGAVEATPENRQLTVMFCDLVDSMALAEKLDPEDLHRLLVDFQTTVGAIVKRYGGHIAQYLGDGILVYFGYPQAHDDDARRAVQTGLEVVDALDQFNQDSSERGFKIHLRIGIHTGDVVTGEVGFGARREILALGSAPNIAARLQGLAQPDTVVLSEETHHLVQGFFEHRSLGLRSLKGLSRPIEVHQALRESDVSDRFALSVTRGLNPLVGRERELALLWQSFEQAECGTSRVVLLGGEPGLGKSRLIQAFGERASARAGVLRICHCSPHHQGSALYPIVELLRELFHCPVDETATSALDKLEDHLGGLGFSLPEVVPLFASLLAVRDVHQRYPTAAKPTRKGIFEALIALLLALAAQRVCVLVVEDLHWVDPSTLELLDLLAAPEHSAALLLLLSFRPVFKPPWAGAAHQRHVELRRLDQGRTETLASSVAGDRKLPAEVLRQIVEKTDGVPLFVEELTKSVLESNLLRSRDDGLELTGALPRLAIPTTLQGSLAARLDRLGPAKEVAQLASVFGREFSYDMLEAASAHDERGLRLHLARLVDAELLYQRADPSVYIFKHALIRDCAYHSLLRRSRRGYHKKIARLLSDQLGELAGDPFELVAHHYEEAGLDEPAINYLLKAGQSASKRSAFDEARAHLDRGLTLLKNLDQARRDRLELELRTLRGPVLVAQFGYAAQQVEDNYKHALQICEKVHDSDEQLFWVLRGLWSFYLVRAELSKALQMGHRLMQLAERRGQEALAWAHHTLGLPLFFRGEHKAALEHIERGLGLDSSQRDPSRTLVTGFDRTVTSLGMSGIVLWHLGQPERALDRGRKAIALARRMFHPFSLVEALSSATWLLQLRGDHEPMRERAEELSDLARKNGFKHLTILADFQLGWLTVLDGDAAAGARRIHRAIEAYRANGAKIFLPHMLFRLAEARLAEGEPDPARIALDEALTLISGQDFCWLPELHRLSAAVGLAAAGGQGHAAEREAETALERAIDIARSQDSASFVLRASLDLGHLWVRQGKTRPARDLVAAAIAPFTEGLETADLRAARTFLEELTQPALLSETG